MNRHETQGGVSFGCKDYISICAKAPGHVPAIIDGSGPHDATVTALAQAVPYRWDRSPDMLSRRGFFKTSLSACGCALCGVGGVGTVPVTRADEAAHIRGQGFDLSFVGAQRETIVNGKLASAIDVKTLASRPHVYAIGPIEELRGEVTIINGRPALARVAQDGKVQVTESFETGAPFLVWAEGSCVAHDADSARGAFIRRFGGIRSVRRRDGGTRSAAFPLVWRTLQYF
jgi:hypothetical protein